MQKQREGIREAYIPMGWMLVRKGLWKKDQKFTQGSGDKAETVLLFLMSCLSF